MNTKQIGNITELECMLAFVKAGYNVLTPYGDCERYDFVVDINGKLYKMQSKTSKSDEEKAYFEFSCSSCNRKDGGIVHHSYTKDEIDFFVTIFDNQVYLIPVEECGGRSKKMRLLPPKNNQVRGITWAKDFKMEEMVKNL